MLKKTISFTNFNGEPDVETVYFNLSINDLTENIELEDELNEAAKLVNGEKRELTTAETKQMLGLIKKIIRLAYGVKSEDGRHHRKSSEIWADFVDTAVYDALLLSLFTDPTSGVDFINKLASPELLQQADAIRQSRQTEDLVIPSTAEPVAEKDTRPAWERENREPTQAELQSATPEQMRELYSRKIARPVSTS